MARPVAATIAIALIGTALVVTVLAGRRSGRTLRKLRSRSHQHAMAARPAAYRVAGQLPWCPPFGGVSRQPSLLSG
ncbi:MAG TPA: hypothetical protein VET27_22565, partial [Mycobacterium sp.]|nr:hypothetical protein [Mycobacterium sp.]